MSSLDSPPVVAADLGEAAGGFDNSGQRAGSAGGGGGGGGGKHAAKGRSTVAGSLFADDFFRLCHDDASGRLLLHPRVAGLGLAAALLGELVFIQRVNVEREYLRVVAQTPPPDALGHKILDHMSGEAQVLSIRTWLAFISGFAYDEVAQRLVRARHVRAEESRRLLRRTITYVPTDMNTAAWPAARLAMRLRRYEPLDHEDTFLAGLARATDLHLYLLDGAPRAAFEYLALQIDAAWQVTQALLHHTQAAVGDIVLSAH